MTDKPDDQKPETGFRAPPRPDREAEAEAWMKAIRGVDDLMPTEIKAEVSAERSTGRDQPGHKL